MKRRPVCARCGSSEVQADCYANWDFESQQWVTEFVGDKGAICNDACDGETRLKWVELTES